MGQKYLDLFKRDLNTLKKVNYCVSAKILQKTITKKMISFFSALNHIHVEREMRKLSKKKNDAITFINEQTNRRFPITKSHFDEFLRTNVKCTQKRLISFQITRNF